MKVGFTVLHSDYGRLSAWWLFFPRAEGISLEGTDSWVLQEKLYRSQWDPNRAPGQPGHSTLLTVREVKLVRSWYDYLPEVACDESDEEYAEYLDDLLARYA